MSDRCRSLTVVLDTNMRVDDAERIMAAIGALKCVISVKANVSDLTEHIAIETTRRELGEKLWAVLYPKERS